LGGEGRFVTGALLGAALASAGWPVFAGTVLATKLQAWRRSDRTVYLATLALASGLVFLTRCDSEAVGLAILVADVMGVVLAFVVPNSVAAWCIGRWVPALGRRHAVWALAAAFIALEFAILHLLSPAR
jgi:hypothetical protein